MNSSIIGLETEMESSFFHERLADSEVWHSLYKQAISDLWVFPAGSNSTYTDWVPGQPQADHNGSIVGHHLIGGQQAVYGWKSAFMDYKASVICEKGIYFDYFAFRLILRSTNPLRMNRLFN